MQKKQGDSSLFHLDQASRAVCCCPCCGDPACLAHGCGLSSGSHGPLPPGHGACSSCFLKSASQIWLYILPPEKGPEEKHVVYHFCFFHLPWLQACRVHVSLRRLHTPRYSLRSTCLHPWETTACIFSIVRNLVHGQSNTWCWLNCILKYPKNKGTKNKGTVASQCWPECGRIV